MEEMLYKTMRIIFALDDIPNETWHYPLPPLPLSCITSKREQNPAWSSSSHTKMLLPALPTIYTTNNLVGISNLFSNTDIISKFYYNQVVQELKK